ncbi:DUF1565 domain-containing protein [Candidatus Manganitrophus noduliformans]|nr:DUF1565 domain-containing protein [Candidatus Manganitrophus noduliformans]
MFSQGRSFFYFTMLFLLAACSGGGETGSDGTATVGITMKVPAASARAKAFAPAPGAVSKIAIRVTDDAGAPLAEQTLDVTPGETVTITLQLPAGRARYFLIEASDSEGNLLFLGDARADLEPGGFASVVIKMVPVDTPAPPKITLSPPAASVAAGTGQTFTAEVTGLEDPTVVWTVNEAEGGNPTVGTITQTNPAVYTAPQNLPATNPVTIKATSASNPAIFATASVTLLPPPTLRIDPDNIRVLTGRTQIFTATITGLDDPSVTWSLLGDGPFGTIEQIDATHAEYTAPEGVPFPNQVRVQATSVSDPALSGTAAITIITPQTTIFVDAAGRDSAGCGSDTDPCKTVTQGVNRAKQLETVTTVLVAAGTYSFGGQTGEPAPLAMPQGIALQGAERESILDFTNATGTGIVGADNASLSGFTVRALDSLTNHIEITNASPTIQNNLFVDCGCNTGTGILIRGASKPLITKNSFGAAKQGLLTAIRIENGAAPRVVDNSITDNKTGLEILSGASPIVQGNMISRNKTGISVDGLSKPDLGSSQGSAGGNTISCNADVDLVTASAISARGNAWDHVPPKEGALVGRGIDLVRGRSTVDTVNASLAPKACRITLTAPSDGALVRGRVTVTSAVADLPAALGVTYSVDDAAIGNSDLPPSFPFTWDTIALQVEGPHTLRADLIDSLGVTDSDSVSVTVDNTPPVVGITSPKQGDLLGCGGVSVIASATDANGISRVGFFASGAPIGEDTIPSGNLFSISWSPPANGPYTLTAQAFDRAGNTALSAGISVRVSCITSIQVNPPSVIVPKDQKTQPFTLEGATNADVVWRVNGAPGGDDRFGKISPDGIYVPPKTIPTDDRGVAVGATVEAVGLTDPAIFDSSDVTLVTGKSLIFDPNIRVTTKSDSISTVSSGQRNVAFFKGNIYAVWSTGSLVLFAESKDGVTWAETPLASGTAGTLSQSTLAVAPDGTIYVAYRQRILLGQGAVQTIHLTVRRKEGEPFQMIDALKTGTTAQDPTVAVSSKTGNVVVAWSETPGTAGSDIFLQRIDPAGNPIDGAPRNLTEKIGAFNDTRPTLSIGAGDEILLVWEQTGNSLNLLATASRDGGQSFFPPVQVNEPDPDLPRAAARRPSAIVGPEGSVYVAWEQDQCGDGCTFIFFNAGEIGLTDLKFIGAKALRGGDKTVQTLPSVALDEANGLYIALHERVSLADLQHHILLAKSTDRGNSFVFSQISKEDPAPVSIKSAPSIAVDTVGRAFAIWTDQRITGSTGTADVFFSMGE